MEKLLCPSMMCANYGNLEKEVQDLIDAGVDIFHIDIMDTSLFQTLEWGYRTWNLSVRNQQFLLTLIL